MNYVFKINDKMKFKIKTTNEKKCTEKNSVPCKISFSANALFADLVSGIFEKEEK